jgi:hypothetical protein
MTGDSTVAEIEASGGSALGVEVDVTDHEVVNAMVARGSSRNGAALMSWSPMPAAVEVGLWTRRPATTSIRRSCSRPHHVIAGNQAVGSGIRSMASASEAWL